MATWYRCTIAKQYHRTDATAELVSYGFISFEEDTHSNNNGGVRGHLGWNRDEHLDAGGIRAKSSHLRQSSKGSPSAGREA
jgi:hypothetical protein